MYLYHYTKYETAINKILPFKRLKFNYMGLMNDPVENLMHLTNTEETIFENKNMLEFSRALKVQKEWQALCFSTDREYNGSTIEGGLIHRMWTQYGDNNKGICLVIDYDEFKKENEKLISANNIRDSKVSYNTYAIIKIPQSSYR